MKKEQGMGIPVPTDETMTQQEQMASEEDENELAAPKAKLNELHRNDLRKKNQPKYAWTNTSATAAYAAAEKLMKLLQQDGLR